MQIKFISEVFIYKNMRKIGYDADDLYLWDISQEMLPGEHKHIEIYELNN